MQVTVYRFTKTNPPTERDFVRFVDTPKVNPEDRLHCDSYSISVLADASDIPRYRKFVAGFSNRRIAEARLDESHGVLLNTPNIDIQEPAQSHHDWWVPVDIDPLPLFSGVEL